MSLDSAIQHLLAAKRISNASQSYAKDNPGEWAKVKAYLDGGARPTGVVTEMGVGLMEVEDARRGTGPPPDPDPPGNWPVSFYTGPAGQDNILPSKQGVLVGATSYPLTSTTGVHLTHLENWSGRKMDVEHRFLQHQYAGCGIGYGTGDGDGIDKTVARGHIPLLSWVPGDGNGGRVLRGDWDACIRQFGTELAAQPHHILLRPFHEFNGNWYAWSKNVDGSMLTTAQFKALWIRTVDILKSVNAHTRASFVWCPAVGYYDAPVWIDAKAAYPGDSYVDWIGADEYNWGPANWRSFSSLFDSIEGDFRGRKPLMICETGAVEDPAQPGRKGQWFRDTIAQAKALPGILGHVYFDVQYSDGDWRIGTSQSSIDGWKAMATDSYFNVR